ncbi:Protein of uncharacterised function (DUF2889) [Mycobacterium xenopi]|uniref:Uncharacterized protein n=2 Tax=Mycobacterium xenopi TaxID=1789 RepID=A0AAD1GXI6_MYCXE|nr:hypothetical protein MYXE_08070 [Mycobacterium xenopi]SPX79079.1 Protein of uncharacterised function (DUF2889) [Mycobacterium xenopi]
MAPLPIDGMRRRRRLDIAFDQSAKKANIDAMFRDTYVRGDGQKTIIHEYTLTAAVDVDNGMFLRSEAVPRVRSWQEMSGCGRQRPQNPE